MFVIVCFPKHSNFAYKSQIFRISFQKMLRILGLGLGLQTFAKFLRVSIRKIWSQKKISVSEKFGLGKKSRFRFWKIWYRQKSLSIGFGQNFGIVIQWCLHVNIRKCLIFLLSAYRRASSLEQVLLQAAAWHQFDRWKDISWSTAFVPVITVAATAS